MSARPNIVLVHGAWAADMKLVRGAACSRKVDLVVLPTAEAIGMLSQASEDTNAVLRLAC